MGRWDGGCRYIAAPLKQAQMQKIIYRSVGDIDTRVYSALEG